jgi:hypothetical protein
MAQELKTPKAKSPRKKGNGRTAPYPSLAKAPSPAKRLAIFLKKTGSKTGKAMTERELEQWLKQFPDLWPDEAEIDEFARWLRAARREGRYA